MAEGGTPVPYPQGAKGDASVLLELVVEADGSVSSADVVEGEPPFAEQARRAALGWRFVPAQRDHTAVAARIRVRIELHQPRPTGSDGAPSTEPALAPAPATQPGSTPAAGPPAAPAQPAALVPSATVPQGAVEPEPTFGAIAREHRRDPGQTTLSAADVRELPGAFGDPFRAIEPLPGVMPVVSGLPYFYVRGAPPNDNAYFVDGVRVPLLFHIGIGEGVIHPSLIDRVDFYPSVAPAAYGGSAGAVIAGQTRAPAAVPHGELSLRLIDAGALLESPFGDSRGSALVAGRYGYPGPIVGAITPSVRLGYWDYQARATYRVGGRDTLGIFAFGSHDYLGTAQTNNGRTGPVVEQLRADVHRIDLRYDRALTDGRLRIAGTLGYDAQGGAGAGDQAAVTTVTDLSAALRLELDTKLSRALRLRSGADAHLDDYTFAQGQAPTDQGGTPQPQVPASADPPPENLSAGAYTDLIWHVTPRVEVVPGARVDVFASTRANGPGGSLRTTTVPAFDPRLSTRVTVTPALAWLTSVGLAHQYPALRVGAIPGMLVSVPGFPRGDTQLQTGVQAASGPELALPAGFTLTTTGFFSAWRGLTDLTGSCLQIMPPTTPAAGSDSPRAPAPYVCPADQPIHGLAYGVELLLRRSLSRRLSGWLSYTLSRSTRREHFVTLSGGDATATVASDYDRTHVLSAILAYDLGRGWRASARFVFLSGNPYSELAGNVPVPPYNAHRDPPFFRLDVRLEKRWALGGDGYIALIVEGQNVTLSKQVTPFGMSCMGTQGPQGGTTQCRHPSVGPITIPSIGAEASF